MSTQLTGRLPGAGLAPKTPLLTSPLGRLGLAVLILLCGIATFFFGCNYFRLFPTNSNPVYEAGLAALFLGAALWLRRSARFGSLWPLAYAFFVANMVWLLTTLAGGFGNWALRLSGLASTVPAGVAVAKVGEAIGAVAIILALCLPAGFSLSSLYLKRGNLKWALAIGLLVILNFGTAALMSTASQPRDLDVLGQLILWGLVFSLANGLMEELWFRGLFLGRLAPHIGTAGAVIITALLFSLVHLGADYLEPAALTVFLINTLTHALVLGFLILKTDTLWGAVLYHAAMDLWLFIGPTTLSTGG
jgi:membrane protease YdiL (CAAX protease family)